MIIFMLSGSSTWGAVYPDLGCVSVLIMSHLGMKIPINSKYGRLPVHVVLRCISVKLLGSEGLHPL